MLSSEAPKLIGRAFSGDGGIRVVTRVEYAHGVCDVYWSRPGGRERKVPVYWPYFVEWLETANEIDPQSKERA